MIHAMTPERAHRHLIEAPAEQLPTAQRLLTHQSRALASMDHALFVSRCQLELPRKEELEKLLEEELRGRGPGKTGA
jgi:hypothetical protein